MKHQPFWLTIGFEIRSLDQSERDTLSFIPFFSPFCIGDGRIASSKAVYNSTIFLLLNFKTDKMFKAYLLDVKL